MKKVKIGLLSILLMAATSTVYCQMFITQVKPQGKSKWGYMDINQNMVIAPQFKGCYAFSENGIALAVDRNYFIIINLEGNKIKTEFYDFQVNQLFGYGYGAEGFFDGMIAVMQNDKWGYFDSTGQVAIGLEFDLATRFDNGLAIVQQDKSYFIINKQGQKTPIEVEKCRAVKPFSEGLAPVLNKEKMWGFIDSTGAFSIEPAFIKVGQFYDGFAWARNAEDKIGFIDHTGEWVIAPRFSTVKNFDPESGMALVELHKEWVYVRKDDTILHESVVPFSMPFREGLAVAKHYLYGFIGPEGNWAIEPKYMGARSFKNGLAAVKLNGKWGFINKQGELVIPAIYNAVKDFELVTLKD